MKKKTATQARLVGALLTFAVLITAEGAYAAGSTQRQGTAPTAYNTQANPNYGFGPRVRVRGARGMDRQRAGIADIGDMIEQLERVDEARARLVPFAQLEADQAAEAALEIDVGAPVLLGVVVQRRIDHLRHVGMALQVNRDRAGIAAMLAHAQRQRLESLDELERVERAHAHAHIA